MKTFDPDNTAKLYSNWISEILKQREKSANSTSRFSIDEVCSMLYELAAKMQKDEENDPNIRLENHYIKSPIVSGTTTGGTKRIGDLPKPPRHMTCQSPSHHPPSHMVYQNGIYEHTCPSCGLITRFIVNNPTW